MLPLLLDRISPSERSLQSQILQTQIRSRASAHWRVELHTISIISLVSFSRYNVHFERSGADEEKRYQRVTEAITQAVRPRGAAAGLSVQISHLCTANGVAHAIMIPLRIPTICIRELVVMLQDRHVSS